MLSQMIREGLVASRRGRDGGYWLARPPAEISYGAIVRLTRGSLGLLPCASRYRHETCKNCISEDQCRLHRVMLMVRDETARILDGLSLADPIPRSLWRIRVGRHPGEAGTSSSRHSRGPSFAG